MHGVTEEQEAEHRALTAERIPIGPTVLYKCARCGQVLEPVNRAVLDEHHNRCFVVGDYVRWEYGPSQPENWVDGKLLSIDANVCQIDVTAMGEDRPIHFQLGPTTLSLCGGKTLRHIQRPVQQPTVGPAPREPEPKPDEDENLWRDIEKYTLGPRDFWPLHQGGVLIAGPGVTVGTVTVSIVESAPVPTPLFDGITSVACLNRWRDNRSCIEHGGTPLYDMTPAQITEGKRMFTGTWSAKLRAKLAASAAAERLTVYVDQDPDDIPWR